MCTVWRLCHISTRQQMSYFTQSSSTGVMITKTTTAPPKHNNNSLIRLVDFKIDLCRTGWICHRNWIRQNTRITYLSYRDKMKNSTSKQEKKKYYCHATRHSMIRKKLIVSAFVFPTNFVVVVVGLFGCLRWQSFNIERDTIQTRTTKKT